MNGRSWSSLVALALTACFGSVASLIDTKMNSSPKVAVIGGGAAGLVAARVLSRSGIRPVVLEKDLNAGGVWRHASGDKSRPMYQGLRTNLPREVMAYREKPWGSDGIGKSYVTHQQVLAYLEEYAKDYDLYQYVSFGCKVTQLKLVKDSSSAITPRTDNGSSERWPKMSLEWERREDDSSKPKSETDTFDAVCICNGHYAAPSIPNVPGLNKFFKGKVIHSIEYDDPEEFRGQTVLLVGARASGSDLAREISTVAEKVYLSDSICPALENGQPLGNIRRVPRTTSVEEDGSIRFADSCAVSPANVDTIVFASGYDYSFPFINERSNIELQVVEGERRVMPLYEQLWHAKYPVLTFIGLAHSVVPFPFFELQAEAVVSHIKGEASLPPLKERLAAAASDAVTGGAKKNGRIQDTHYLGSAQWDYSRRMAVIAGYDERLEDYIATNKAIYDHSGKQRKSLFPGGPDTYRSTRYVRDDKHQSFEVVSEETTIPAT